MAVQGCRSRLRCNAGDRRCGRCRVAAWSMIVTGMVVTFVIVPCMIMAGMVMIMVCVIVPGVVMIAVIVLVMSTMVVTAAARFFLEGGGRRSRRGRRHERKLVAEAGDPLLDRRRQFRAAVVLDRHRAARHRNRDVLDAFQTPDGGVDFRSAGGAIHTVDAVAHLL